MSNILKISTPISGYENNVSKQDPQMKNDVGIKNPVNPDKVVRADSRAEYGNERGVQQGLSYESNFGNFVRTLANIPRASEIMSKMLFSGMRNVIEAGIGTRHGGRDPYAFGDVGDGSAKVKRIFEEPDEWFQ